MYIYSPFSEFPVRATENSFVKYFRVILRIVVSCFETIQFDGTCQGLFQIVSSSHPNSFIIWRPPIGEESLHLCFLWLRHGSQLSNRLTVDDNSTFMSLESTVFSRELFLLRQSGRSSIRNHEWYAGYYQRVYAFVFPVQLAKCHRMFFWRIFDWPSFGCQIWSYPVWRVSIGRTCTVNFTNSFFPRIGIQKTALQYIFAVGAFVNRFWVMEAGRFIFGCAMVKDGTEMGHEIFLGEKKVLVPQRRFPIETTLGLSWICSKFSPSVLSKKLMISAENKCP